MTHLDDHAESFANLLFVAFPDWRQFLLAEAPDIFKGNIAGCLIVKVPAPNAGDYLLIDTCDNEVTVTFGHYHTHFGFSEVPGTDTFQEAIEFIRDLVNENFCIVVAMNGNECCGATTLKPEQQPDLSWLVAPANCFYIRSWLGTYDREYETQ